MSKEKFIVINTKEPGKTYKYKIFTLDTEQQISKAIYQEGLIRKKKTVEEDILEILLNRLKQKKETTQEKILAVFYLKKTRTLLKRMSGNGLL